MRIMMKLSYSSRSRLVDYEVIADPSNVPPSSDNIESAHIYGELKSWAFKSIGHDIGVFPSFGCVTDDAGNDRVSRLHESTK